MILKDVIRMAILVGVMASGVAPAAASPACRVSIDEGAIRVDPPLPMDEAELKAKGPCLDELARAITADRDLRSLIVNVRQSDAARLAGDSNKLAELVRTALVARGVATERTSVVATALRAGDAPGVTFLRTARRAPRPVASLLALTGTVQVGDADAESPSAQVGQTLVAGKVVRTPAGGGARLLLADGSFIWLGQSTAIRLGALYLNADSKRVVKIELMHGEVQTEAMHQGVGSVFDIVTRTAVAGVRGTRFRVATSDGRVTRVETVKGKVELGAPKGKVDVAAGQGSQVDESGQPEAPRALLAAPKVTGPTHGTLTADTALEWAAVPDAASYRLEFAKDAEFSSAVQQSNVTSTRASVAALDASHRWFWRVSAIDAGGFVGLPSKVYAFALGATP